MAIAELMAGIATYALPMVDLRFPILHNDRFHGTATGALPTADAHRTNYDRPKGIDLDH